MLGGSFGEGFYSAELSNALPQQPGRFFGIIIQLPAFGEKAGGKNPVGIDFVINSGSGTQTELHLLGVFGVSDPTGFSSLD